MKKIRFAPSVPVEIRAIEQRAAMGILRALHRYVETGKGRVKPLSGEFEGLLRLRVGKHRVLFETRPKTPSLCIALPMGETLTGEAASRKLPGCIPSAPTPRPLASPRLASRRVYFSQGGGRVVENNLGNLTSGLAGGARAMQMPYIKQLPILLAPDAQKRLIISLVQQILADPDSPDVPRLEAEIDRLVYDLYGLTQAEIEVVKNSDKKRSLVNGR